MNASFVRESVHMSEESAYESSIGRLVSVVDDARFCCLKSHRWYIYLSDSQVAAVLAFTGAICQDSASTYKVINKSFHSSDRDRSRCQAIKVIGTRTSKDTKTTPVTMLSTSIPKGPTAANHTLGTLTTSVAGCFMVELKQVR